MGIENVLKKEGIIVTSKLDTLKVNAIASNIAENLVKTFPEHNFKENELFINLSRLNMYTAKVPNGMSEANYFYKNNSIYINEKIPFSEIHKYVTHECIHYLQERKDKKGHLMRLGLCDLTEFKLYGLAMNEAAVQFATSKVLSEDLEGVKYYGISFNTISPNCYPLECNLINQMAYITGEYTLLDSTFNSNNYFRNKFISLTSEKAFYKIQDIFDKLFYAQEDIIKLSNKLESVINSSAKLKKTNYEINKLKKSVTDNFVQAQELIITSYFDNAVNNISNIEEVENFRRKLYNFRDIIGSTDNYSFFNSYYLNMMTKLENILDKIENGEIIKTNTSIYIIKQNKFLRFIALIRNFLFKNDNEYKKVDEK